MMRWISCEKCYVLVEKLWVYRPVLILKKRLQKYKQMMLLKKASYPYFRHRSFFLIIFLAKRHHRVKL
jgi:hypothetical protein